ncbi:methyltransferase domain-containing protein [Lacibacterium aquatile]|uniref:Methyltransferase domain-containing protein n=1 Tax=Lacibacterium aquatile TaxID=1168082 RepID=A0ABW5DMT0_9PROT
MSDVNIFDRVAVRRNRERSAAGFKGHDFLYREVAGRLVDRLADIMRTFSLALDIGGRDGLLARALAEAGEDKVGTVITADLSETYARSASAPALVADEEWLPFKDGCFDLVTSCLALHWVNDLPGALIQMNRALKPDGLLLAAMLGGETLSELKECLIAAELELRGGVSPRTSPVAGVSDAGMLLQRAGFALPVVDSDVITVTYPDALALMRDLRGMGESNAVNSRPRGLTPPAVLMKAAADYAQRHAGPDGRIVASFEIITMTGWTPAEGQPRPLRPGSAKTRLADALGAKETKL